MRGPLLVGLEVEQGRLERAGEGDHHGAGVVLVHVLLDLRQPEEGGIMHLLKNTRNVSVLVRNLTLYSKNFSNGLNGFRP